MRLDGKAWRALWAEMTPAEQEPIKAKARWEHVTLSHVTLEYTDLVPRRLRARMKAVYLESSR